MPKARPTPRLLQMKTKVIDSRTPVACYMFVRQAILRCGVMKFDIRQVFKVWLVRRNKFFIALGSNNNVCQDVVSNEPRYEKTGLRGFRPGPTQTGLYCHRRWLEA